MKTEEEIRERIKSEAMSLHGQAGHMASLTRGFLEALEWVLEHK